MDAESQLLAEKDAEIERLKEQSRVEMSGIWLLKNQITDLRKAIMEKDAEIERLKLELHQEKQYAADLTTTLRCEAEDKDTLITDLVDWIYHWRQVDEIYASKLIQRARETTR